MARAPRTRMLVVVAVGALLLDAIFLAGAGFWSGRWALLAGALLSAAAAAGVMWSYRRHLKRLDEIDRGRRELRDQALQMGNDLRDRP